MKRFLHVMGCMLTFTFALNAQLAEVDETFNPGGFGCYGDSYPAPIVNGVPTPIPGVTHGPLVSSSNAVVYTASVYPPNSPQIDKIVIGGRFSSYNGVGYHKLARLNADGTLDETFNTPRIFNQDDNGQYLYASVALSDGGVIIGGSFSNVANSRYNSVLKLNSNGEIDHTFMNPLNNATYQKGFGGGLVHALHVKNDNVYVGGSFTSYQSGSGLNTPVNRLVKMDINGVRDASFNPPSFGYEIRSISVQEDGKVIIGFMGGKGVRRYHADGTLDSTFETNIGNGAELGTGGVSLGIYDIKYVHNYINPSLSKILLVGSFTRFNGRNIGGIVRLNLDGTLDLTWNPSGAGTTATAAHSGRPANNARNAFSCTLQPDGKILVAGAFGSYNGTITNRSIARLHPDGTLDTDFLFGYGFWSGTGVYGQAPALRNINLQSDGKLICSGDFTDYNTTGFRMIVRIKTRECALTSVYNNGIGWRNGSLPAIDRYVGVQTGTLTLNSGTHYEACELAVEAGAKIIIKSGASFTVNKMLMNNGEIIIEEGGALVQIEDIRNSDTWAGTLRLKRNTTPVRRFDYTYWSSPTNGQTLRNFSPNTLADKYYSFNGETQAWNLILNGEKEMEPGVGYIVRAPQTHAISTPTVFNGEFRGRANNGTYEISVFRPAASQFNLIGNPYPSAIDAELFIMDSTNVGKTTGNLYFWTHETAVVPGTNGGFEYSGSDYMVYNLTGNTSTGASAPAFNGYISSGQGFMVEATSNTVLTFRNDMRVRTHNTQFYRQAAPENQAEMNVANAKSRIWIDLHSANGGFNQALVGYVPGATNELDFGYDGKTISTSTLRVFTMVDDTQLAIQGRALPFDQSDIIPLGVQFPAYGTYTLQLGKMDGLFAEGQRVFLRDHLAKRVVRIDNASYEFQANAGEVLNRFELWFLPKHDDFEPFTAESSLSIISNGFLRIANAGDKMQQIDLFDMAGRQLYSGNYADGTHDVTVSQVTPKQQVILVKVTYVDGRIETKKVVY